MKERLFLYLKTTSFSQFFEIFLKKIEKITNHVVVVLESNKIMYIGEILTQQIQKTDSLRNVI